MDRFTFRSLVATSAFAITAFSASEGRAFCPAVTEALPAGWNIDAQGCYTGNPPGAAKTLYWKNACIGFSVQAQASRYVPLDVATRIVNQAFTDWTSVPCAGGKVGIEAVDNGPAECAEAATNVYQPNQNSIIFRDDAWPYPNAATALAYTSIKFDKNTGEIYGADIEINTYAHTIVPEPPVPAGAYDFATIVTHEIGHFLGLEHSSDPLSLMRATYQPGSPQLGDDDRAGICAIYPADGSRVTTGGPVAAGPCTGEPKNGFVSQCVADTAPLAETATSEAPASGCAVARAGRPSGAGLGLLLALLSIVRRRLRSA
jgi:hypothetical protein